MSAPGERIQKLESFSALPRATVSKTLGHEGLLACDAFVISVRAVVLKAMSYV